ncbi:MAG: AAC(3) family N-acetyltransferase, partial [Anaeroplasmataceae bacterium]|nr:AAC(3) family N-acetyltransferase [Anaeroplasmataceae bacterium]
FKSYIEMTFTKKEDILFDLKQNGFKKTDAVLLHSSLKSFGAIEGKDIIEAFKEFFSSGLVIFPTHTWSTITKNEDVFDVKKTPSCVGALTNLALKDPDFKRSVHPTHSVCAYGKNQEAYLKLDLNQSTPVSPTGCFGSLWKMNAKILFLGVPLSKNTMIHSIEEEMQVPDRFTEEIYHFTSIGYDTTYSYFMPRHYSTKREHLSENYAKLLPHLLEYKIAEEIYIGNSKTILVSAKLCYDYVKYILSKNIHLFDNDKEYEDDESYKKTKQ